MSTATLQEVARKARIAKSTASKILNNQPFDVPEETRERVLTAARELNYSPNYFAATLKTKRSHIIGLSGSLRLNEGFSYYVNQVARGIENELSKEGSRDNLVVFPNNLYNSYQRSLEMAQQRVMDGIIFIVLSNQLQEFEEKEFPLLEKYQVPFVMIHSTCQQFPFNNIGLDNRAAGQAAGKHLAGLGYRDIGYYLPLPETARVLEPWEGFKKALAEENIEPSIIQASRLPGDKVYRNEIAYNTFNALERVPRALFIPGDSMAYPAIKALKDRGLQVPRDVAVIGYEDYNPYKPLYEDITTLNHPFYKKGVKAIRILNGILDGHLNRNEVYQKTLTPELVIRYSCGSKG